MKLIRGVKKSTKHTYRKITMETIDKELKNPAKAKTKIIERENTRSQKENIRQM